MKRIGKSLFILGMILLPFTSQAQWTPPSSSAKEGAGAAPAVAPTPPPPSVPAAQDIQLPPSLPTSSSPPMPPPPAPGDVGTQMPCEGKMMEYKADLVRMQVMMTQMQTQIEEMHKMLTESAAKK